MRVTTILLAGLAAIGTLVSGAAQAANYTFPSSMPAGCSGGAGNYSCGALALAWGDTIGISGTKPATITVNGALYTNNAIINAAGSASDLNLVVTGPLTTAYQAVLNANVTAASVDASGGGTEVTYGGSVAASSGNVVLRDKAAVAGSISTTSGSITIGQDSTVAGAVTSTGGAVTVGYRSTVGGAINTSGNITLAQESVVSGPVAGATGPVLVGYAAAVAGAITTSSGAISLAQNSEVSACVTSTESAAITLDYHATVSGVCCGSGCGNSCVINNSKYPMPAACGQSALTLSKAASTSAIAVGNALSFTLTATNTSTDVLGNVVVTDVIPTGMAYSASAATLGTVSVAGQTLIWTIPTLSGNSSEKLELVVLPTTQGTFTNTATTSGTPSASATVLVLPDSYVHYRMDTKAGAWSGASGEVFDSGAKGLHAHRRATSLPTTTNTLVPNPSIASQYPSVVGGFCNAASFDGKSVIESDLDPKSASGGSSFFQFKTALSASAWIYPTAYPSSDLYSILSNDTNYEFHLNPAGKLYWWWQASTLTSAATIPLNQWTHVAVTLDSTSANRRQRIYINGVQDANTNNWAGTLAANACPFYIGGDIGTGSGCSLIPGRNFRGMIDEVKIYDYELNAAEVEADMTLGRLCTGNFDHVRIEHDGSASTCSPKTVTLKACLDSSCSALYQGDVTVKLSPSGWVGGDTVTIKNGVATATLNKSSIVSPDVTLGSVGIDPMPATEAVRCFNGVTETCTLSVAATSCSFDAVEPAASPQTHLFTKRAGVAFNVDLLALSTSTTVNKGYKGTVTADVVDTCPGGTVLSSSPATVTFKVSDKGRKSTSFISASTATSAQVRIKDDSGSYACSYDKFAVRPSAAILSTSANAAAPGPAAAPTVKAGATFDISAATSPSGYTGTLTLDSGKLQAQLPINGSTVQSGGAVGVLTISPLLKANISQSKNATYTEVGYLYATAGAFRDTSFTSVDQIGQPADCAATDTCDCLLSSNETNSGVPNYLSDVLINGRYGCYVGNKATYSFGRFIPDHFDTVATQACVAGAFTYSGQPFPLTVTANSAAGGATANYTGKFAKPVNLSARDAGDTADNPGPGVLANTVIPAASFAAGAASATPTYTFNAARTAPTGVRIRAIEPEVSSLRAAPAVTVEGVAAVRSGRARLGSAYGSELLDLPVLFRTEFWNVSGGNAGWVLNAADSCTGNATVDAANAVSVTLAPSPADLPTCIRDTGSPGLSGANACVAVVPARQFREGGGAAGFAGEFNLWLAAPGANSPGWTTVTAVVPAWLGVVQPTRATFGSYRTPLIYRREVYGF